MNDDPPKLSRRVNEAVADGATKEDGRRTTLRLSRLRRLVVLSDGTPTRTPSDGVRRGSVLVPMPRTSHADCDCVAGAGLLINPRSIEGNADGCCRVGGDAAAVGDQGLRFTLARPSAAANDCLRDNVVVAGELRSADSRACMRSWAARFSE